MMVMWDMDIPFKAMLPLFGMGLFILFFSLCFCCYLIKLRYTGRQEQMAYRVNTFKKKQGEEICPVCLDEFSHGVKIAVTRCQHKFHIKCLQQWLPRQSNCPVCKTEVHTEGEERSCLIHGSSSRRTQQV